MFIIGILIFMRFIFFTLIVRGNHDRRGMKTFCQNLRFVFWILQSRNGYYAFDRSLLGGGRIGLRIEQALMRGLRDADSMIRRFRIVYLNDSRMVRLLF